MSKELGEKKAKLFQRSALLASIAVPSSAFIGLSGLIVTSQIINYKNDDSNGLYYNELSSSYVCEVQNENGKQAVVILKENGYDKDGIIYKDVITNTYFNTESNRVLSKENITVWLQNMGKIQDWYSSDELVTILADVREEKKNEIDNGSSQKTYIYNNTYK
jgi:hypothetical protein